MTAVYSIDDIRVFLDGQHALPGSSLGKAHRYTGKLWEGLIVFLSNPAVPIHTNGIEGALRHSETPHASQKYSMISDV